MMELEMYYNHHVAICMYSGSNFGVNLLATAM